MNFTPQIEEITNTFGMKAEVAAKAMGITVGVYRKNKSAKVNTHNFNQKNVTDLINYIKQKANKL